MPAGTTHVAIIKGAPDRMALYLRGQAAQDAVTKANQRYAEQALRVLVAAIRPLEENDIETLE